MDLERRVEALEQEVQILKNQIQATLLEIQEHLLNNAHPSLRTEAAPPPTPPEENPARIKKVVLEETLPHPPKNIRSELAKFEDMKIWAEKKAAQLGVDRTLDLIHSYVEAGRFSPVIAEVLMEHISAFQMPTSPPKKAIKPVAAIVEPKPVEEQNGQFRNVVLKLIAGVQNIGIDKARKQSNG